jgi:uncharacterized RDD family membrane protein YckC
VTDAPAPIDLPIASAGKRFLGATVDGLLFLLLALATTSSDESGRGLGVAWFAIAALYEVGLTAVRGQTLGKMAATTQVVHRSGARLPTWTEAFVRWLLPAVPSIVGFFLVGWGVDVAFVVWTVAVYLPILNTEERRGWHDRVAGTVVIDRARVPVE